MVMDADSLARVTEGQRACLRMVLRHMSSKDIARTLGISRHTVDQRLKLAMKTLGATSRVEAARTLAAMEGTDEYQRLTYQASDIESAGPRPSPHAPVREGGQGVDLQRIGWIVAIAAGLVVGLAALLVGLNALADFTR